MSAWLPIAAGAGSFLGGLLGGESDLEKQQGKDLKRRAWNSQRAIQHMKGLEKDFNKPIDMGQMTIMAPMIAKMIAPYVRGMTMQGGSRFGVRSPISTGNVQSGIQGKMAGAMSGLYSSAIQNKWNQQNMVFGHHSRMAGA